MKERKKDCERETERLRKRDREIVKEIQRDCERESARL